MLARRLTHRDFPEGAYLLIYSDRKHNSENINLIREDDENERTNDVYDEEENYQKFQNHKNRHSFRFKRNADRFTIDHCCSKEYFDICKRYFCH